MKFSKSIKLNSKN